MDKEEWIEKELAAYALELPVHNRAVLRQMKSREYDYFERESFREDSNNSPVEGYFNSNEQN